MSAFQVTTVNRLQARKLLHKCGVDGARARAMSLRELQEHLQNFVTLGSITESAVCEGLAVSTQELNAREGKPANAGAPWTATDDNDLLDRFCLMFHRDRIEAASETIQELATAYARTPVSILARLEKHGILTPENTQRTAYRVLFSVLNDMREARGIECIGGKFVRAGVPQARENEEFKDIPASIPTRAPKTETTPVTPAKVEEVKADNNVQDAVANALGAALGPIFAQLAANKPAIDVDQIRAIIAEEVPKHVGAFQRFEVVRENGESVKVEGLAHYAMPRLLRAVGARTRHDGAALNIWLYGPAGTGKSTAARKLAEAMSLDFHTNGPVGSQWDIRGFTDAQGRIVETAFRRAWINGGVYCWDEGDGSSPAALIEANGALATGFASFPDGVFKRHKDCIVIINGNLRPGAAPDATYNGRYKQDTAFVNRFVAIEWGIDEELERALLGTLNGECQKWYALVRKIRGRVKDRGLKGIVISPRQAQYGCALIDAGADLQEATEQVIKFMFTDEQWQQVAA